MNLDTSKVVSELTNAVHRSLANDVPHEERLKAYHFLEEFQEKSSSNLCVASGFIMASREHDDIVRHFGLKLVEHRVKFKWPELPADLKNRIMENTMDLIACGTNDILTEKMFIKDVVTRIIVEMVKREWPQQWPDLLTKLDALAKLGPTQSELVLFIFLRLAEDIVLFQILPGQRRKDIHRTLNAQMQSIFAFFIQILDENVTMYLRLQESRTEEIQRTFSAHCRVAQTVLYTLCGYVDWISFNVLFTNDATLLSMVCLLLSDSNLQLQASEVLLSIVTRKGKVEERKPILVLFKEEAMTMILNAAQSASKKDLEEAHYLFLKTLCKVLVGIGEQLCTLWVADGDVEKPDNFLMYLHAILAIGAHSSQVLGNYTQSLWSQFLRHPLISKDEDFLSILEDLIKLCMPSLQKVGFPSQSNHVCCLYSRLDFDSDEEFNAFLSRYRAEIADTVRLATLLVPQLTFRIAGEWLTSVLSKPLDLGEGVSGHCNLKSPAYLEWDAMTCFLESVLSRITLSDNQVPLQDGIQLLRAVLQFKTEDPLILSLLLSCISALFQYIEHASDLLSIILDKIFATVVFNIKGQTKGTRIKSVQNVRRHACSVLVKICKEYSQVLLPGFDRLCSHVDAIISNSENVSQMERCTLMEALILINNRFMDCEKQTLFIARVLQPIEGFWVSSEFKDALISPAKFMHFIGLDQAPVEPGSNDTCGINRANIANCINNILACIKRSKSPDDLNMAKHGGFVQIINGKEVLKNPATTVVMTFSVNVLKLVRVMNEMWLPEFRNTRHEKFAMAFELPYSEKQVSLGIPPKFADNTDATLNKLPVERMQNFLQISNDNAYHIFGNAAIHLGYEFYAVPQLAESIVENLFHCLPTLPDYRIRPMIRSFMKPFIQHCPDKLYATAVMPIVARLSKFMYERLNSTWQMLHHRASTTVEDDENPESQEVLEEQLTRQLTREYIDLLSSVIISKRATTTSNGETTNDDIMDDDAMNEAQSTKVEDIMSDLGKFLIKNDVYQDIVLCVFTCLSWNDTTSCHKSIPLCSMLLKQLHGNELLSNDAASVLFTAILRGLQVHGQHESTQPMLVGLALQAYELLRSTCPNIAQVILQIPSCSENDLKLFDEKLAHPLHQKSAEKKKKEAFKKLICGVIAKSLAHQFRKEVPIQDLPSLFLLRKKKPPPVIENSDDAGLAALFHPE